MMNAKMQLGRNVYDKKFYEIILLYFVSNILKTSIRLQSHNYSGQDYNCEFWTPHLVFEHIIY